MQMFGGHANGFLFFHLPLLLLLAWLFVRRPSYRASVGLGLTFLLIAAGEWHQYYYSTLFVAVWLIFLLRSQHGSLGAAFGALKLSALKWLPAAALSGAGLAMLLWFQSHSLAKSASAAGRSVEQMRGGVPVFRGFISQGVLFVGNAFRGRHIERGSAYVGLSVLVLLAGFLFLRRRLASQSVASSASLNAAFFAWTIPVTLLLMYSSHIAPLHALVSVVPYWTHSRVPVRMMYIVSLALAVLVCHVLVQVQRSHAISGATKRWIVGGASFFIVLEFVLITPRVLLTRGPRKESHVLQQAASLEGDAPLLILPITSPVISASAYVERLATVLARPMINGYSPAAPLSAEQAYQDLVPMNEGKFTKEAELRLLEYGVNYILVDHGMSAVHTSETQYDDIAQKLGEQFSVVAKDSDYMLLRYD